MANILDYLQWRGDLSFTQDPANAVDSMVFCVLSYIRFSGTKELEGNRSLTLKEAAAVFFQLPDCRFRCRGKTDLDVLAAAAKTGRFGNLRLTFYREEFVPEEDTQFAAETYLLDDGSAYVVFRGTDKTLVGWKEDFNMCFQQTVPSQRLAVEYVREIYSEYTLPMRLCGHSKGGNLAIFAAARSSPMIQESILEVYNNDGPGFTEYMMGDPGYLTMVPRIHTYVPQSSVVGMLMDREEPYTIVHSSQVGILQHDTYTWSVMGREPVLAHELTADAQFIRSTARNWLQETDLEERNQLVEALFTMLTYGNVERAPDIFQPKNWKNYLKLVGSDENIRKVLTGEFENFLEAAAKSRKIQPETELPKIE